jgi:hypothetical protein
MLTEGSTQPISLHAQSYMREYRVVFTVKLPLEKKTNYRNSMKFWRHAIFACRLSKH